MFYAVIKGNDNLLKVLKLSDWQDYEWEDFAVVKNKTTKEIEWFFEEEEAIEFMIDRFDKDKIDPKYFEITDNTGEYYIG